MGETAKLAGKGNQLFFGRHHLLQTVEELSPIECPEDLGHQAEKSHAILTNAY